MPPFFSLFFGLTVLGALSPLLTFAALFQQKEWRMDRLIEHLRHEGAIRQLWGKIRPLIATGCLLTDGIGYWLIFRAGTAEVAIGILPPLFVLHTLWLLAFTGLGITQRIMNRQRVPVWTMKARLIVVLSFLLTALITWFTTSVLFAAPLILLAQPLIGCAAWLLLLPLDRFLKFRHFARATAVRNAWTGATVIGIAGSVGKTTTKELLRHVLADLHPFATPEHVNTEMGVAQWMAGISDSGSTLRHSSGQAPSEARNPNVFIVEMGAYRTGEIALMCEFVKPTIGVMTALGSDHLALFGSEQAIIDANAELLQALPENGHAFLYADNDAVESLTPLTPCAYTLAGERKTATLRAEQIEQTDKGLRLTIDGQTSDIALHGLHNVGNILLAVGVAKYLGIGTDRIHAQLRSFHPLTHTFHVRQERGVLLVDDTYNSSRLSIRAALDWAKQKRERPRVLLLSSLLETGNEEGRFLEELGALAKDSVERVIFTAVTGREAFEKGYGKPVEIINTATTRLTEGSLLLCVGRMPLSSIQKLLPAS